MHNQEWYIAPKGVRTKWASPENMRGKKGGGGKAGYGRKGLAYLFIRPGERITLAEETGVSGMIRRIWMTLHGLCPRLLKQLRLEMYWDGAEKPAVNVPLGDFFCMGLGRLTAFENACFSSPEGRSMNCFIPMPFRTGMRVDIINDGFTTANMLYYDIDYTVGDNIPKDALYFHAWYNQELPTTLRKDYTILSKVEGRGRFLGASFGVFMDKVKYGFSWGGEGEVKFYIDDDHEYPTLCGTGTEDYVGTGWCQGLYSHLYQGFTVADEQEMHLCFHRFHIPDPIYFEKNIRVTIQQIGSWNPNLIKFFRENGISIVRAGAFAEEEMKPVDFSREDLPAFDLFERSDYWTSCCYFYLDKPQNELPAITDVLERVKSIPDFDEKELYDMNNELPELRIIRKYLANYQDISLEELKQLKKALEAVIMVLTNQENAMKKDE
ncbi:MAG TPA: DUF2961 domain-containing protein [Clostridiales bacterium]|nr:DUF2961 domain-containing protein [Clostridiales bacterium]